MAASLARVSSREKSCPPDLPGPRVQGEPLSTARQDSGLLSPMRALLARAGDEGLQSDPALEPSTIGGHTLLQRRLALYGKALVAQSILYWLFMRSSGFPASVSSARWGTSFRGM